MAHCCVSPTSRQLLVGLHLRLKLALGGVELQGKLALVVHALAKVDRCVGALSDVGQLRVVAVHRQEQGQDTVQGLSGSRRNKNRQSSYEHHA